MRLNQPVVGEHPATSGYQLECFVSSNGGIGFPSGSGTLNIEFPRYAIERLEFSGKNALYQNIDFMKDIAVLENAITLETFFSGDLNGASIQNVKKVDIYTGSHPTFAPDSINFTNRIDSQDVLLQSGESSINLTIYSDKIDDRTEENIFYRALPRDYLTFGEASDAVSGVMFGGFEDVPKITSDTIISRSNANDLRFYRTTVDIFAGVEITIFNDLPKDYVGNFRIRTDDRITIRGKKDTKNYGIDTAKLTTTIPGLNVVNNTIVIPTGNEYAEFEIASLLDENDERTAFLLSEL